MRLRTAAKSPRVHGEIGIRHLWHEPTKPNHTPMSPDGSVTRAEQLVRQHPWSSLFSECPTLSCAAVTISYADHPIALH
jgi:hypothetical protein